MLLILTPGCCNIFSTVHTLIAQNSGNHTKFVSANLIDAFNHVVYNNEFTSDTVSAIVDKSPIGGYTSNEIYFSSDRSIKYESKKYACNISKDINIKSVKWETFKDAEGTESKNWCHIYF